MFRPGRYRRDRRDTIARARAFIGGLKGSCWRASAGKRLRPQDNERDLPDIPENIRNDMKLHFVTSMDQVLRLALESELEMAPISAMQTAAEIVAQSRDEKITH